MGVLNRNSIFKIVVLTFLWVILREGFSVFELIIGVVLSTACVAYARKFLPLTGIENVKFYRLILYIFYLIGQIYVSGYHVIKIILHGHARSDILQTKTKLNNKALRVILGESITLTPGSIMLDLDDDVLTVLLLLKGDEVLPPDKVDEYIRGALEEKLMLCQKG